MIEKSDRGTNEEKEHVQILEKTDEKTFGGTLEREVTVGDLCLPVYVCRYNTYIYITYIYHSIGKYVEKK